MRDFLLTMGMLLCVVSATAGWDEGVALVQSGDFTQARPHFQELANSQPGYAGGWYMLAVCDERLGEPALARVALLEALAIDPHKASWKLMLADIESKTGRSEAALAQLEGIESPALDLRGQRRFVEVLSSLEAEDRVLDLAGPLLSSTDAGVLARLGELLVSQGELGRGTDLLERSFVAQIDARVGQRMVAIAQTSEDFRLAAELASLLASTIAAPEHDLLEGESWLAAGESQRAMACFERSSLEDRPDVALYRAQGLRSSEDWSGSEELLRAALTEASQPEIETRLQRELAYVLVKQERRAEAVEVYRLAGDEVSASTVEQSIADRKEIRLEAEQIAEEEIRIARMKELADQYARLESGIGTDEAAKHDKDKKENKDR